MYISLRNTTQGLLQATASKIVAGIFLSTLLFPSCIVSKKKFDEATQKAERERAENAKLTSQIATMGGTIKKQNGTIGELTMSVKDLKGENAALSARINKLKDSINTNEDKISSLHRKLSELGDENQETSKELTVARDKVTAQRKKMEEELASQRKRLETDLATQKKQNEDELAAQRKKLEEQIAAQQLRVAQLESFIDQQQKATEALRKKIADALAGFNSSELTITRKNGKVYISMQEGLLFPSGSAVVNPKGKEALSKVASVLNANDDVNINVEGHTDSLPIRTKLYPDNWSLSTARATSIAHVLIDEYKVTPARLVASGRSQYDPLATNSTPEGRSQNRRTEIILEPKLDVLMDLLNGPEIGAKKDD